MIECRILLHVWSLRGHRRILALHKSSEKIMYTIKNSFMQTFNLNSNRGTPFSEYTDRRAIFS